MSAPDQFAYHGHHVEIVPPDEEHLIGKFWQVRIDGVLQKNVLYSSWAMAVESARKLVDQEPGD
jgi:hypothetical protein